MYHFKILCSPVLHLLGVISAFLQSDYDSSFSLPRKRCAMPSTSILCPTNLPAPTIFLAVERTVPRWRTLRMRATRPACDRRLLPSVTTRVAIYIPMYHSIHFSVCAEDFIFTVSLKKWILFPCKLIIRMFLLSRSLRNLQLIWFQFLSVVDGCYLLTPSAWNSFL